MFMKKIDELLASNAKLAELLGKKVETKKKCNPVACIFAVIGVLAAIALVVYGIYRFFLYREYYDDFDDDSFEITDEDEFEDESTDTVEE